MANAYRDQYILVDETNLAAGTNYYNIDELIRNNDLTFHLAITGNVIITFEATLSKEDEDWFNITPSGYSLGTNSQGNSSYIASDIVDFEKINALQARVKVVTADATNVIKVYTLKTTNNIVNTLDD